jgi:hypothetical protein
MERFYEGGSLVPVLADRYRGKTEYLLVYSELIQAARYRGVTTYQAIAEIMGLLLTGAHMGREVGYILGEISEDEVRHGRPMLSAIAVSAAGVPGGGFFGLARDLGRLQEDTEAAERRFWEEEKEAVYATWQRKFKS